MLVLVVEVEGICSVVPGPCACGGGNQEEQPAAAEAEEGPAPRAATHLVKVENGVHERITHLLQVGMCSAKNYTFIEN